MSNSQSCHEFVYFHIALLPRREEVLLLCVLKVTVVSWLVFYLVICTNFIMVGYTADEKLRVDQLVALRRKWLKDQELTAREPVVEPKPLGRIQKFWAGFLEPKSLWRLYVSPLRVCGVFFTFKMLKASYYHLYDLSLFTWNWLGYCS